MIAGTVVLSKENDAIGDACADILKDMVVVLMTNLATTNDVGRTDAAEKFRRGLAILREARTIALTVVSEDHQ